MPWQPVYTCDVPKGRTRVTGTITKIEERESELGLRHVMTVHADEGYGIWGTLPVSLLSASEGDRVRFRATLEPSEDNPRFGFFSRPTNGEKEEDIEPDVLDFLPPTPEYHDLPF